MSEAQNQPETRRQCRHIHTDGRRCGSPTLRGASAPEHFCFYHHTTRRPLSRNETQSRQSRRASFDLPNPEDRAAIQHAIGQVLIRIAANQIDPRRAGLLLYGLQIASLNLPKPAPQTTPSEAGDYVEEVIADPIHGPIAPEAEYTTPKGEKTLAEILMEQWEKDRPHEENEKREENAEGEENRETREAEVLNLQAQSAPEANPETPNQSAVIPLIRLIRVKPSAPGSHRTHPSFIRVKPSARGTTMSTGGLQGMTNPRPIIEYGECYAGGHTRWAGPFREFHSGDRSRGRRDGDPLWFAYRRRLAQRPL